MAIEILILIWFSVIVIHFFFVFCCLCYGSEAGTEQENRLFRCVVVYGLSGSCRFRVFHPDAILSKIDRVDAMAV